MFSNAHTIAVSQYCIFTETVPRLIHYGSRLLHLCRGCGFRPTVVNSRQPCSAKMRFYLVRVRMGLGKPGKSWNLSISVSRPGKSWNFIVGHGKVMENYSVCGT